MTRGRLIAAAGSLIVTVVLVAVVQWFASDSSLERARIRGIRVGYAIEPPYAFIDEQGRVTGESPEVARLVAERLGVVTIEWQKLEFGALLDELAAGHIEMIASGMFVTPEREKRAAFTIPTFHVRQALLVGKGNPHQLHSYEDAVRATDLPIAVLSGSIEEALLLQLGIAGHRLTRVPDARTGHAAVSAGVAAGLALSAPSLRWVVQHDAIGVVELAEPFAQPEQASSASGGTGAFVFRRKDPELLDAWNSELRTFVGSAEHVEIVRRFGFLQEDLPQSGGAPP